LNLGSCLALSGTLFAIGAYGLLTRRNFIAALISLELMVNAALINFVAFARYGGDLRWFAGGGFGPDGLRDPGAGPVFALFAVGVTAAEMALALAMVVSLHRQRKNVDITELDGLRG
jgi:NADH:ubiquinone oxidoreductase subunit K